MRTIQTQFVIALVAFLGALTLSGCGGGTVKEGAANSQPSTPSFPGGPGGGTPDDGFVPAYSYDFQVSGMPNGSTTPTCPGEGCYVSPPIMSDSILKVRLTAGPANQIPVPGYGFTAEYRCVEYKITLRYQNSTTGLTTYTQTLRYGDGAATQCPNAPTSQVIDFSAWLGGGSEPLVVEIKQPRYDFMCNFYNSPAPWPYQFMTNGQYFQMGSSGLYCPLKPVYQNHIVTGTLGVQVNGTTGP